MYGWRGSRRRWGWRRRGHAQLSIDRLVRLRAREVGKRRRRGGGGMSGAGTRSVLLGRLRDLFVGAVVGGGRHARGAAMRPQRWRRRGRRGLRRSRPQPRGVLLLLLFGVVVHGIWSMVVMTGSDGNVSQSLGKCVESKFGSVIPSKKTPKIT